MPLPNAERLEAVFISGQIIGLLTRLNTKALKEAIEDPEFRYAKSSNVIIQFKEKILDEANY